MFNVIVPHTATVPVVALAVVAQPLFVKFVLDIFAHVTVQLVSVFHIVHVLLVGFAVAQFPLNVTVGCFLNIAYNTTLLVTV